MVVENKDDRFNDSNPKLNNPDETSMAITAWKSCIKCSINLNNKLVPHFCSKKVGVRDGAAKQRAEDARRDGECWNGTMENKRANEISSTLTILIEREVPSFHLKLECLLADLHWKVVLKIFVRQNLVGGPKMEYALLGVLGAFSEYSVSQNFVYTPLY